MKKKQSFKVLWNVFLFVICGGSIIYGVVQHKKSVDDRLQKNECQQSIDSLRKELDKTNVQLELALKQLQAEKVEATETVRETNKPRK